MCGVNRSGLGVSDCALLDRSPARGGTFRNGGTSRRPQGSIPIERSLIASITGRSGPHSSRHHTEVPGRLIYILRYSLPLFNALSMYQKAKWDIETVCELTNPTQGYPTCSAQAVTYRRRCKRQIAHGAISAIRDILEHLTTRSPCATAESPDLYEAAKLSVCWQHRDQIGDVARRWKEALKALARRTGKADGKASYSTHGGIKQEDEGDIPPSARRARGRKVNPESYEMRPEELSRLKEMLADRRAQEKRKEEATVKEEREKAEKERQRRRQEAEERQRRRQEAEERQRRHEREAEEKRKQEEREKREEILRQRARKRQQDREDAARKEWADAWKRYSEGWAEIEDASHHSKVWMPS